MGLNASENKMVRQLHVLSLLSGLCWFPLDFVVLQKEHFYGMSISNHTVKYSLVLNSGKPAFVSSYRVLGTGRAFPLISTVNSETSLRGRGNYFPIE